MRPLAILFGALFTGLTAWALGRLLLQRLQVRLSRAEGHLLGFAAGAGVLGFVLALLAAAHLIYDATLLALGAGALAAVWRTGAWRCGAVEFEPLPRHWRWLFWSAYAIYGVLYLANAMAPEMSPDGTAYHLSVMGRFYHEHGFVRIENMYAMLSQGVDLLLLMAYAFGRHSAASVLHFLFLLALPLLILNYARRVGQARAGALAGMLVFLCPVAGKDGVSAYNDIAVAALVFAVFYAVEIWRAEPPARLAVLIGVLGGACYAAKYTAFLAGLYALAVMAWTGWRQRRPWFREVALAGAVMALLIAPWLLRNAIWYANPFAPLLNAWFPNPYIHISFEREYAELMRKFGGINSYAELPRELLFSGARLGGFIGPIFALLPLGLVALRWPAGRRILLAALVFLAPYPANIGARFLLPALPFCALAMGMALTAVPVLGELVLAAGMILSWPSVIDRYPKMYAWRIQQFPWRAALRVTGESDWLRQEFPDYVLVERIEQATPRGAVIYSQGAIPEAYTTREVRISYQSAANERASEAIWAAVYAEFTPRQGLRFAFSRTALRGVRLVETARHASAQWGVNEVRVFDGAREAAPTAQWRLRARPNPWDVQLAFDLNRATRWRTWQPIAPGMHIEVDFGTALECDAVLLETAFDQYDTRVRLEGRAGAGAWRELAAEPAVAGLPLPLDMRREAAAEMRRLGVTHVLMRPGDVGYEDMQAKTAAWGAELVADVAGARLYRLLQ